MDRQSHVDGLRGLAALFVVLHHIYLEIWPLSRQPEGLTASLTQWLLWGHFAVAVFIVISGYCLALPVIRGGAGNFSALRFYRRRALRILPPYYLGLILSTALVLTLIGAATGTHWDAALPFSKHALLENVLLIPEYSGKINHAYWSIGVECKIYLLFPLILLLCRWIGVVTALLATSALAFAVALQYESSFLIVQANVHFLGLFCFGVAAAYIVNSEESFWSTLRDQRIWTVTLAAATGALVLGSWYWGYSRQHSTRLELLVGVAAVALFVSTGKAPEGWLRRSLAWKPLAFLGGFSYSLYLVHAPLIQLFWQYGIAPLDLTPPLQFATLVLTLPLILLCAWAFHVVCERPFIPVTPRTDFASKHTPEPLLEQ